MKAKSQEPTDARPFDPWPRDGSLYQSYDGEVQARQVIAELFTASYGQPPAVVLWCKPGLWWAGPVAEPADGPADTEPEPVLPENAGPLVGCLMAEPQDEPTAEAVAQPRLL